MLIVNPKREHESIEVKPYWYNYYAGYSHTFTQKIIESADLDNLSVVLDPWNGAGTTTLMASVNGHRSIGVDLNPVMKVIASAKQAVNSDIEGINRTLKGLKVKSKTPSNNTDHLNVWFDPATVNAIRNIEHTILEGAQYETTIEKVNSLTKVQCLLYTGLFNCVRSYLDNFIPSNPTWIKKPKDNSEKVSVSWLALKKHYIDYVKDMIKGISVIEHEWPDNISDIRVGSSTDLDIEDSSVDLVLTSPPYCTRIDYGVATLPELSVLCVGGERESSTIRRQLMGTTTVPREITSSSDKLIGKCVEFLRAVESHSSKASKTYYYKNLLQYFLSLDSSIIEIERVLRPRSNFICVIQDSYYKDVHCDLPGIICEMAETRGLELRENIEFESKKNMANLNIKSKRYRSKNSAFETVLIFTKGE